jgi:LasA protease
MSNSWIYLRKLHHIIRISLIAAILLAGCSPATSLPTPTLESSLLAVEIEVSESALFPTRPQYTPGELVNYIVQTGDTLPAIASHFNTTEDEIINANQDIPEQVTTLPPGMPLEIPIYYEALWGSAYQILPDSHFIYGPSQIDFDTVAFVDSQPGWLKNYTDFTAGNPSRGGEIIEHVATNFSISPRLLLTIVEYQTGALSNPIPPEEEQLYPLGFVDHDHQRLAQQLVLAANHLNNGYYGWRTGNLSDFEHSDGRLERPDPWQNAASVALQYYLSILLPENDYIYATHNQGILKTYTRLFGDPWIDDQTHIPASLAQPPLLLPFEAGKKWNFTGGPHTGWGTGEPWAAVDFAPSGISGCGESSERVTALADGIIVRTAPSIAVLDLDEDGYEQTGWVIFYLHLASNDMVKYGTQVSAGQPVGRPSCEGGSSTGTHIHIARKYNGEWIPAGGLLAFELDGWVVQTGDDIYIGELERFGSTITASSIADMDSLIEVELP